MEPTYVPGYWACYSGARCSQPFLKGQHPSRDQAIECAGRTTPRAWADPSVTVARVGEFPDMTPEVSDARA